MAVNATLYYDDGFVGLLLLPIGERTKVADDPNIDGYDPGVRIYYYWDADKLEESNIYDFLGIEIIDISYLYDEDLDIMDQLDLPRVNVVEAGFVEAKVSDVLRWARNVYPSRYTTISAS